MSINVAELKELAGSVPPSVLKEAIFSMDERLADVLLHDWGLWARPNQLPPSGDWRYWLLLAGRGFGKTRTVVEWVREQVKSYRYVNIIGATSEDTRSILIEGESGILNCCSNQDRPRYISNQNCLKWPNGAISLIFTAAEPERLRGKQHEKLLMDELFAWRYADQAFTQAMLGLRLGNNPQAVISSTPRPSPFIKRLIADPTCHVTRGTTYDNKANLAPAFFAEIIKAYEGTRLGRQELNAEILEDNPNALWQRSTIDECRLNFAPATIRRIVIGVDPASTAKKNSDETGIIVAGIDPNNHGYVLDDLTGIYTPNEWAKVIAAAYDRYGADRVIAETNNGGDMVEAVLRSVAPNIAFRSVHASRGKAIRAEPISSLYERHLIHHIGSFPKLEDQMCDFDAMKPPEKSPDRCLIAGTLISTENGFIPIENIEIGMKVKTRNGYKKVIAAECTNKSAKVVKCHFSNGTTLEGTPNHPIFSINRGFISMDSLVWDDIVLSDKEIPCTKNNHNYVVPVNVLGLSDVQEKKSVYNLTVEDEHEYFANGILTHNCDAMVWAFTELFESTGLTYGSLKTR